MKDIRLLVVAFVAFSATSLSALASNEALGTTTLSTCWYQFTTCYNQACSLGPTGSRGQHVYWCDRNGGSFAYRDTCCGA